MSARAPRLRRSGPHDHGAPRPRGRRRSRPCRGAVLLREPLSFITPAACTEGGGASITTCATRAPSRNRPTPRKLAPNAAFQAARSPQTARRPGLRLVRLEVLSCSRVAGTLNADSSAARNGLVGRGFGSRPRSGIGWRPPTSRGPTRGRDVRLDLGPTDHRSAQRFDDGREVAQGPWRVDDPVAGQLIGAAGDVLAHLDHVVDVALRVRPPRDGQAHQVERRGHL